MTRRGLIAPAIMRVSFPGYDVYSAGIDQTCFDSRWSGLTPYIKGTLDSSSDASAILNFGETLGTPPLMFGYARTLSSGVPTTIYGNSPFMLRGGGIDQWFYVEVGVSAIAWRCKFGNQVARLYFALYRKLT